MSTVKRIGFLNFGHWSAVPGTRTPDPAATLTQTVEMAVAAEEAGLDGAWIRSHHFQRECLRRRSVLLFVYGNCLCLRHKYYPMRQFLTPY